MAIVAWNKGFAVAAGFTYLHRTTSGKEPKDIVLRSPHKIGQEAGVVETFTAVDDAYDRFLVGRSKGSNWTTQPLELWCPKESFVGPLEKPADFDVDATIEDACLSAKGKLVVAVRFGDTWKLYEARVTKHALETIRELSIEDAGEPVPLAGRIRLQATAAGVGVGIAGRGSSLDARAAVLDGATLATKRVIRIEKDAFENGDTRVTPKKDGVEIVIDHRRHATAGAKTSVVKKKDVTISDTAGSPFEIVARATSPDGKRTIVAYGEFRSEKPQNWGFYVLDGDAAPTERTKVDETKAIDLSAVFAKAPPKMAAASSGPDTVRGPPVLGVLGTGTWSVKAGAVADVSLTVKNTGGAATDLLVKLGGPALDGKLVSLASENEVAVKIAPAINIEDAKRPILPGETPLVVRVRGEKAGTALLTIRVTTKDGKASALVGKSVTVS